MKGGLLRVWLLVSSLWLIGAAIYYAEDIGFYFGYHASLLENSESVVAAFERKDQYSSLAQICTKAHVSTCIRGELARWHAGVDQDSCERADFLEKASLLLEKEGFSGENPEACDAFIGVNIPQINWNLLVTIVLPVFAPLLLWFLARWVVAGFAKNSE
ncbi:hypothetical protein [Marinobacter shengliensis]